MVVVLSVAGIHGREARLPLTPSGLHPAGCMGPSAHLPVIRTVTVLRMCWSLLEELRLPIRAISGDQFKKSIRKLARSACAWCSRGRSNRTLSPTFATGAVFGPLMPMVA